MHLSRIISAALTENSAVTVIAHFKDICYHNLAFTYVQDRATLKERPERHIRFSERVVPVGTTLFLPLSWKT